MLKIHLALGFDLILAVCTYLVIGTMCKVCNFLKILTACCSGNYCTSFECFLQQAYFGAIHKGYLTVWSILDLLTYSENQIKRDRSQFMKQNADFQEDIQTLKYWHNPIQPITFTN